MLTWMNGRSCFTEEQYKLSKALLFQYLDSNEELQQCVGQHFVNALKMWLNVSVIPLERWYVFYKKTYVECCMDEYVNNSVEGMNYTQKKAEVSAKPNMNMATSATKMLKNNEISTCDRMSLLAYQLLSVPLYVDPRGGHNIDCLSKLVTMALHFIIQQYKGEKMKCLIYSTSHCANPFFLKNKTTIQRFESLIRNGSYFVTRLCL